MAGTMKAAWEEARKKRAEEFWKEEAEKLGGGTKTIDIKAGKPEAMRVRKPSDFKQAWYQSSQFAGMPGFQPTDIKYAPTDESQIETVTAPVYRNVNEVIPPADMNDPKTFAGMVKRAMEASINPKEIIAMQQKAQEQPNKLAQIRVHPNYQKMVMNVRPIVEKYGGQWDDNLSIAGNVNNVMPNLNDAQKAEFNKEASGVVNKPTGTLDKVYTAWEGVIDRRTKQIASKYKLTDADAQSIDMTNPNALAMLFQKKGLGAEASKSYLAEMEGLDNIRQQGYQAIDAGESPWKLLGSPFQKKEQPNIEQDTELSYSDFNKDILNRPTKKVIKRGVGQKSGRPVVKYEDGTEEYAD